MAELLGVLGFPVSHSLSPEIFEFLGDRLKRPLYYKRLPVSPKSLPGFLAISREASLFHGFNVTIPHKESVASFLDELSAEAQALGAVNVVSCGEKAWVGHNTDVIGIRETFQEQGQPLKGKSAALIGAGGAALAVAYVLGEGGAREVRVFNRSLERAKSFCVRLSRLHPRTRFRASAFGELSGVLADLYINATPLGMKGFDQDASLLPRVAPRGAFAFDLVYRPMNTPFLLDARKRGLRSVGGLDMLLWQAIGAYEIWFGPIPKANRSKIKGALSRFLVKRLSSETS